MEVVEQYWNNNSVRGIYKKRLNLEEAKAVLRDPLDPEDEVGGKYVVNANVPIEEAQIILRGLDSGQSVRAVKRSATVAFTSPIERFRPAVERKTAEIQSLKRINKEKDAQLKK